MKLHILEHASFETPGAIIPWARKRGCQLSSTKFYLNDPLPTLDGLDALVIMGGPMSANDDKRYSWLSAEKKFIEAAIEEGISIIGICLGAQLLANVLGARVYPNKCKEIGWFPLELTPSGKASALGEALPAKGEVFHWHGETFDLPDGAVHLARSEACEHQAFLFGPNVLGLQFHLEFTQPLVEGLIAECSDDLRPGEFVQSSAQLLAEPVRFNRINALMERCLDKILLIDFPSVATA